LERAAEVLEQRVASFQPLLPRNIAENMIVRGCSNCGFSKIISKSLKDDNETGSLKMKREN
jgi:hypothetical protein